MNYIAIAAFFAVMQFASDFIASKGASLTIYVILSTLMIVGGTYLYAQTMILSPNDIDVKTFAAFYFIIACITVSARAWHGDLGKMLNRFDTLAVLTVVLTVAGRLLHLPAIDESIRVCVITLCICLFAAMVEKTEQSNAVQASSPMRGRILLGGVFALFAGLVYLIVSYAGSGAKSVAEAVVWLGKAVLAGIVGIAAFILSQYMRFMRWIDSLTPDKEPIYAPPGGTSMELPEEVTEELTFSSPLWFKFFIVALILAIIIAVLYRLRNVKHVSKKRVLYQPVRVKRQSGFMAGLKAGFRKLAANIRFAINNIKYKNTVAGLLIKCEKNVPKDRKRLPKESPQAFLRRLAVDYPDNEEILEHLAKLAEIEFYKASKQHVPVELAKAVRAIKFYD
ncbi:MAG: hypothetical protein MJ150_01780 [Clostridia bacterium]|nr:hypothetical protein [Clostridia bacterium]